ncbi:MAG: CoA-binding protein [Sulfuricaulis sp.]
MLESAENGSALSRSAIYPSRHRGFGASDRRNSVGGRVLVNLQAAGFDGPVFPINPKHDTVAGRPCFHSISKINAPVDLHHAQIRRWRCTPQRQQRPGSTLGVPRAR